MNLFVFLSKGKNRLLILMKILFKDFFFMEFFMQNTEISRHELWKKWHEKIMSAEKKYADYYDLVNEIREYYRNDKTKNKQNIFWASIETLKPFLYFKQPKPYVIRSEKFANEVENVAARILERALKWNMKQFDFDSVVKYARNDFLLSGFGLLWEQYCLKYKYIGKMCLKDEEKVVTDYVNPVMFLADCEKVSVWEDVEWIARKMYMSEAEIADSFALGDESLVKLDNPENVVSVYEIWDKPSKTIYYLSPELPQDFLLVKKDTLHLSGFFPCPKPFMSTLTNDGIIPVPDYVEIKSLLDELDGVNNRMRLTMQALKVSGCYDNSFPELANILDKDVTLISLNDFEKLKDAGGLKGILEFAPIDQYIQTLSVLATRRQSLIEAIYEITGVSDIMRGSSNANETATAVKQKTNFGTLRNQDRQNDMQRFLRDLLRIKAEIICEQFSAENLASFAPDKSVDKAGVVAQAVKLLKTDKIRDLIIDVETDTCFDLEREEGRILKVLDNINSIINQAFGIVSAQPALLPLYRQMLNTAVASMPNARQFENTIASVFDKIAEDLNKPLNDNNVFAQTQLELQKQKLAQDYELKKEQNQIKHDEFSLKALKELRQC